MLFWKLDYTNLWSTDSRVMSNNELICHNFKLFELKSSTPYLWEARVQQVVDWSIGVLCHIDSISSINGGNYF